ncbi:DUF6223 family protein [Paenibacillus sp. NPDC056579]|uniref:DUF6223 family protein n=1 Tax=Paenibacillus sp. NPDC056579 TaxID=3345871 RepID=UPI0036756B17
MKKKLVSFVILCTFLLVPTIASADSAEQVYGFTPARIKILVTVVMGLGSVGIAWLSLARASDRSGKGNWRIATLVAIALALIAFFIAGPHFAYTTGDIGSGNGRGGAAFAVILSIITIVLSGMAWFASRYRTS